LPHRGSVNRRSQPDCTDAPLRVNASLTMLGAFGGVDPRRRVRAEAFVERRSDSELSRFLL